MNKFTLFFLSLVFLAIAPLSVEAAGCVESEPCNYMKPNSVNPNWWRSLMFFVGGELRYGILDRSDSGPFQGPAVDSIKDSYLVNGSLVLGAYYPIKKGWSVGLELGGVTKTNLYAYPGETELHGNIHNQMLLARAGVLNQLNQSVAVGFQIGGYIGDQIPVGRLSFQIGLTSHLKFEVSAAVEKYTHFETGENVWLPQIGAGLVYWF